MRYFKKILDEFTTWKWIFFIMLLFPYGGGIRLDVAAQAHLHQVSFNKWDIILVFLSDFTLIFYLILPFWLFFSSHLIIKEWEYTLLIRVRSFPGWMLHTIISISPVLLVFQTLWILISFLVTISIPYESSWSALASIDSPMNYLIFPLQQTGLSPWCIFFMQTALLSLFLIMLHVIMAALYVIVPQVRAIAAMSVFLFAGIIISLKIFPRIFPPDFIWSQVENYIIISCAYYSFGSALPAFLVSALLIICCVLLVILWQHI